MADRGYGHPERFLLDLIRVVTSERLEDIPLRADYILRQVRAQLGLACERLDEASLSRLQQDSWPGNVRELQHLVERAALLVAGPVVEVPDELLVPWSEG